MAFLLLGYVAEARLAEMLQCRQHADGMQARGRLLDFARHEPAAAARPMRDVAAERARGGENAQCRDTAPPCPLRR